MSSCQFAPGSCGMGMAQGRDRHVSAEREGPRGKTLHIYRRREGALLSPGKQSLPSTGFLFVLTRASGDRGLGTWNQASGLSPELLCPACALLPCSEPWRTVRGPWEMLGQRRGCVSPETSQQPCSSPSPGLSLPAPSPQARGGQLSDLCLTCDLDKWFLIKLPILRPFLVLLDPCQDRPIWQRLWDWLPSPNGPYIHLQGQQSHVLSHPCSCLLGAPWNFGIFF